MWLRPSLNLVLYFCSAALLVNVLLRTPPRVARGRTPLSKPPPLPHGRATRPFARPSASPLDDWARPRILEAFAVPCPRDCAITLFVVAQGLVFPRQSVELRAAYCLVGNNTFSVVASYSGLHECKLSRAVASGELISLLVERTPTAEAVRRGQLEIVPGKVWTAQPGDLAIPDQSRALGVDDVLVVASAVTTVHIEPPNMPGSSEGRYEICLMTQEKNWGEDLVEWVAFHRRLGVDKVYIYDNGVQNIDLEAEFKGRNDVQVVSWPHVKSQETSHAYMLVLARRRCEWLLLIDVDEWLLVVEEENKQVPNPIHPVGGSLPGEISGPLREYAAKWARAGVDSLLLRELKMGSSGHQYRPSLPIAEAYTYLAKDSPAGGLTRSCKPLVRVDYATPRSAVHFVRMPNTSLHHFTAQGRVEKGVANDDALLPGEVYLVHFSKRSWEDYVRKVKGGRNGLTVLDWGHKMNSSAMHPDRPPSGFLKDTQRRPFTRFRDYWRRVTGRMKSLPNPVLSRIENGTRCRQELIGLTGQGPFYCEKVLAKRSSRGSFVPGLGMFVR